MPKYLHDMSKEELIDYVERLQEQKEHADMLNKALDKAVDFIDDFTKFACPYEIDSEEYMINWSKCSKCGSLVGQEHECWKEWCLENVD